mgnify:CR=1 FL=1
MTSVEAQERDHLDVPTHPQRFKQRIPTPPLSSCVRIFAVGAGLKARWEFSLETAPMNSFK